MASSGMQIHGDIGLSKALDALGDDKIVRRIVNRGLNKTAQRVENRVLLNLARVTKERTGNLANSIGIKKKTYSGARVYIIGPRISGGFRGFHGHLIEFGTKPRITKSGKSTGAMPPRPFMRPAFDGTLSANKQTMKNETRKGIEREYKKRAKKG